MKFARFDPCDYESRGAQHDTFDRMTLDAENLTRADAVRFARMLLVNVNDSGITYADFQSAKATQKYVRQAIRALKGLSF
jgi:hypothetical protein